MWFKLFWVDMSMVEMEEFNRLLQNTNLTNGLDLVIWKKLDMDTRQFMMVSGKCRTAGRHAGVRHFRQFYLIVSIEVRNYIFSILTIGGNDQKESEKFDVHEGPESSILTSPDLYYYYDYPEIFVVPQDFCQ